MEDSASDTWKGTTSPPKKISDHDAVSREQKDPGASGENAEAYDFYEDSDSEGSAQGEGQYGEYR
jgi:hypothetical protein